MHSRFAWSANLVHASWHLKETVARTGVYRVSALARLDQGHSTIFIGKGELSQDSSTKVMRTQVLSTITVEAQAPMFTRVQQARKTSSS